MKINAFGPLMPSYIYIYIYIFSVAFSMTIDFLNITRKIQDEHIFDPPSSCFKGYIPMVDVDKAVRIVSLNHGI